MRRYVKLFSGNCPEVSKAISIAITFEEAQMCGTQSGAKAMGFACEYRTEHGCNSCGSLGLDCPLFKEGKRQVI